MTRGRSQTDRDILMSNRLRLVLIAICTLIFCSCRTGLDSRDPLTSARVPLPSPALFSTSRTPTPSVADLGPSAVTSTLYADSDQPPVTSASGGVELTDANIAGVSQLQYPPQSPVWTGPVLVDAEGNVLPRGTPPGVVAGAWTPPGIAGPWPQDEFLADGGDLPPFVGLAENGVMGVNPEDTVARFQTADGTTRAQAFNRVFIYSPRFSSVRQVIGVRQDEQAEKVVGTHASTHMARIEETQPVGMGTQNYQAVASVQRRGVGQFETRQRDGAVSQAVGPRGFSDAFKPYENFSLIAKGEMVVEEMPALAQSIQAALAWNGDSSVQVVIEGKAASEEVAVTRLHSLYRVESRSREGKLRLVKVASASTALPGETVDFTLRFDNVGTLPITDLIIIDNLSTRLEYVEGTSQSSLPTEFATQPNEAGSLTLTWKLNEPLPPGEGGVIRFQCRVR